MNRTTYTTEKPTAHLAQLVLPAIQANVPQNPKIHFLTNSPRIINIFVNKYKIETKEIK
jgi:hypothetical protein